MSALGDAVFQNQLNIVNKNLKPSVLYTKLELAPGRLEWLPLVNIHVKNLGREGNKALLEMAKDGTQGVSGAWVVQGDGTVKLALRANGDQKVDDTAQYMRDALGATVEYQHQGDAIVQFDTLQHFVESVSLYTKAQMNEQTNPHPSTEPPAHTASSETTNAAPAKIVVFYDSPCIDGAAAAWTLNEHFKEEEAKTRSPIHVKYVPLGWGKPGERTNKILSNISDGQEVIFVDTSPKDDTLKLLANPMMGQWEDPPVTIPKIEKLTIIDHHASEVERLEKFKAEQLAIDQHKKRDASEHKPALDFILHPDKPSAAVLTWEHFHQDEPAPSLFKWIGKMEPPVRLENDHDFAVAAFIDAKDISTPKEAFATIGSLKHLSDNEAIVLGNAIRKDQINNIKHLKQSVMMTELELLPGVKGLIPIVNANVQNFGRSVNGVLLEEVSAENNPPPGTAGVCGAWFVQGDGTVKLSLRSNGEPNVGEIAKHLGSTIGKDGGGHMTDAAVIFEDLQQFAKAVPLCPKEQKSAEEGREDASHHATSARRPLVSAGTPGFT